MSDAVIGIVIDASRASPGARVIKRDLDSISDGGAKASTSADRLRHSLEGAGRSGGSAVGTLREGLSRLNPLLAAMGAALSVTAIKSFTSSTLNAADAIAKMADRTGLGIEALQEYQHAAGLAGVSAASFELSIQQLNRRVAEGKTAWKTTEAALEGVADQIASTRNGAERTKIAMDAFGRSGAEMIPLLQGGSAAVREMRQEARDLGLVLDEASARGAEQLNDEMSRLFSVIRVNIQQGLLRALVSDSSSLRDIYSDPAFQSGLRTIGSAIGEIGRQAGQAIKEMALLLAIARDPSIENLKTFFTEGTIIGLVRRTAEGLGIIERGAKPISDAFDAIGDSITGLGQKAPEALGKTIAALELKNEKLGLMVDATALGDESVRLLTDALTTYDELVKAEIIPDTATIVDSMKAVSDAANVGAGRIAALVESNSAYEKQLKDTATAQEAARKSAADLIRDQQRQQEAYEEMMATPARQPRKEVAARLARLFAGVLAPTNAAAPA